MGSDKDKRAQQPKNWPAHIPYLTTPRYSPRLTASHLQALRTRPPEEDVALLPADSKPGPSSLVRIVAITDPAHPAHGQAGLFAARDLAPGAFVVLYVGEVHVGTRTPSADDAHYAADDDSDYDLWLDRDADLAVDAARAGNEARFVNDYRGVPVPVPGRRAARPNAEFRPVWDARRRERAIAVFVVRAGTKGGKAGGKAGGKGGGGDRGAGIAKGEEILVSYGKGFWGTRRAEAVLGDGGEKRDDA